MSDSRLRNAADPGRFWRSGLGRMGHLFVLLGLAVAPFQHAIAQQTYQLDQRFGTIGFTVRHLGLFSSQGEFRRFQAQVLFDQAHPEQTQISVDVDARSEMMGSQQATDMLGSKDFLDVHQHPVVRFISTSVMTVAPDRYRIQGMLRLRGVTRPLVLSARLIGRHIDPLRHDEQADLVATGSLRRSAFGMTTDEPLISDLVTLTIRAHVELATNAG